MDLAIISVSLKLPNINSLDELYKTLKDKKDCLINHPEDRFSSKIYYGDGKGKMNTKRGGYLKDIYNFDNNFFKFPKEELLTMDPQQRLLLELTYELIYDSNYSLNDLKNSKTGVFIGSCNTEYFQKQSEDPDFCNEYSITGGLLTLLSNRISYFYDLKGPSITIDTACSSSGNALHLACNSIKTGESDLCIVGGSNLILNPETTVGFSQGKFLSPDGKCKSFDNSANGYVRSEGIVLFMIKELDKAIKDNDKIYTVIKSTNVNQDGKTSTITVPNSDSQIKLMNESIKKSGIDVNDVIYIEAHGTGTKLGDKVESNSIGLSYGKKKTNKLNIGSIKTNIGHTEATSGLASICKLIVMMQNNEILPIINYKEVSKEIDLNELNLNIVTESIKINKEKYYMAINNYGFGGANFHCILENYKYNEINIIDDNIKNNLHLLCIYGNNENQINKKLLNFLNYENDLFLKYLYNQNFNDKFNYAKILILKDKDDLENYFFSEDEESENVIYGKFNDNKPKTCFVFCGQGPQFLEMGIDFMEDFPYFKQVINNCDNIWKEISGFSFIQRYGIFTKKFSNSTNYTIYDPIIAQPALTFFHIALFELYKYFGIIPDIVIGHSAGEQASFYASGAITLKEALLISYYRSINQQKTSGTGNMLAINDSIKNIDKRINSVPKLELAAINSENSYVLAGPTKYIDILQKKLSDNDILSVKIRGNCPFHSSYQDIIKDDILSKTKSIKFRESDNNIELISTVTGYNFDKNDYEVDYWWKNIREKVNFYEGIEQCIDTNIFVEIAPHKVLSNYVSEIHKDSLVLQSANRKVNSSKYFLKTLVKLYFSGLNINFDNFGIKNNKCIPKHLWVKDKYYQEPKSSYNRRNNIIENPNIIINSINKYNYVKDHIIGSSTIVPTVYYIDMICKYYLKDDCNISNISLLKMYNLDEDIFLNILKQNDQKFTILNKNNEALCKFEISNDKLNIPSINEENIKNIIDNSIINYNDEQIYEILSNKNYNFREKFKLSNNFYKKGNEMISILKDYDNYDDNLYAPALDCGLIIGAISHGLTNNITYIPFFIKNLHILNKKSKIKYVYSVFLKQNIEEIILNSYFYDSEYNLVAIFNNLIMKCISNMNTNIYEICDNNTEIEKKDINEKYMFVKIEENNLLTLRDLLLLNQKKIHLIDISENYEIVGFIRTIFNELDHVNFKVCYYKKYNENIKKLMLKCNDLESFYIHEDDKLVNYKLKDYNNIDYNFKNFELTYSKKGTLDNLYFKNKNDNKLCDNELEIEIKYSSINFKDIAVILNLVEDEEIGCEFSGIVTKTNSDKFMIGDEVFGASPNDGGSLTNLLTINEKYVWKKPENISLLEAGAFSLSYCTSYISLIKCAKITKDDIVLIHSASGALGLSCLEICKYIGCKIIVSTSSEEKRCFLKNNYDFDLMTNSRNPDIYKKDIMNFTNNKGVNVIISSTVGKSLQTNIEILSTFGRIVDLGKRHIYNKESINVKDFLKSVQYYSVHFDKLLLSDNELIRNYMNEVLELVNTNKIKIFKINEYDISNYKEAFNIMSRSNQIGKIVLKISNYNPEKKGIPDNIFLSEKYYLITGGLGGLGSKLVNFMSKNGARKFILTTRKDKYNINNFDKDLDIHVIKTNLLNYEEISQLLEEYDIDGIFHLAGMIKDKLAKNLDINDVNDVLNIKKIGLMNLGKYFENKEHTYFIAFSSIVALIGNISQCVYSGANSYMDEYCRIRNKNGLPGLSINLGAIGGTGLIANNFILGKTMKLNNIDFTHFENLFIKMKECILDKNIYQVCITDQNWNNLNNLRTKYIFSNYIKKTNKKNIINIDKISEKIKEFLKKKLDQDVIDSRINLLEYGIDSLLSMELANWFSKKLNINIKQIDILKGITLDEIISKYKNENKLTLNDSKIDDNSNNNLFYFKTNNKEIFNNYITEDNNKVIVEKENNEKYNLLIISLLPLFIFLYYKFIIFFFV